MFLVVIYLQQNILFPCFVVLITFVSTNKSLIGKRKSKSFAVGVFLLFQSVLKPNKILLSYMSKIFGARKAAKLAWP